MATSTRGSKYWHAPVRWGRCNVRDMEGLRPRSCCLRSCSASCSWSYSTSSACCTLGRPILPISCPSSSWPFSSCASAPSGASLTCSRNACRSDHRSRPQSQPHTPTRSLLYRSPARPGPCGHSSRGCACSYEVGRVRGHTCMVRAVVRGEFQGQLDRGVV